jgi:hypothetical protein
MAEEPFAHKRRFTYMAAERVTVALYSVWLTELCG